VALAWDKGFFTDHIAPCSCRNSWWHWQTPKCLQARVREARRRESFAFDLVLDFRHRSSWTHCGGRRSRPAGAGLRSTGISTRGCSVAEFGKFSTWQEQLDAFADGKGAAAGLQERIRKAPKTSQSHLKTWQLCLAQEQLDALADAEGDAAGLQERIATVERQLAAAQAEAVASKQELTSAKAALSSAKDELSSAEAALSEGQAATTQMQVRLC